MSIKLSSKAQTLKYVESKLSQFIVPDLLFFKVSSFKENPKVVIHEIKEYFQARIVVIRSSAADEDGEVNAAAGEYDSVLNVASDNEEEITSSINTVISSFESKRPCHVNDEFIVQEMVNNSSMSGVVFTHDLNTGAPYYVINYDDVSGLTNTVTSGEGEYANRTLYIHRGSIELVRSDRFLKLLRAIKELERALDSEFLDIEFALSENLILYLLQVRAITTQPNWNRAVSKRIDATLTGIQLFVRERFKRSFGVFGRTTVLGQMPDWNPVEMIGRAPRALAYSLYKTLITDYAWRTAREIMGYATPTGKALMMSLAGQPYIDTRLSFHSYLPATLPSSVSEKLVNIWINKLKAYPELHDKVEFDVSITTYSFDINSKIDNLIGDGLDSIEKTEFKKALHKQTIELLKGKGDFGISNALEKVELLSQKQKKYKNIDSGYDLSQLLSMIDDCVRLGTVQFSILARHGFIARTILLSLVQCEILTMEEADKIQASVRTVASELVDDMRYFQNGKITLNVFMNKYGHLRPGTYDILSRRYDQMKDMGVNYNDKHSEQLLSPFELSAEQNIKLNNLLEEEKFIGIDSKFLIEYIRTAIVAREYSKFIFTRSVSDILELIAKFGEEYGLSRNEMSHIPINDLLEVVTKSTELNTEEHLRNISKKMASSHELSVAIRLPQVLFDEAGVHVVPFQVSYPNFITDKKITAFSIIVDIDSDAPPLNGKIVLIENADPGFDWIFAQNIGGLITKYGGANSHMAIRCAEFKIPAAIGCGEQRFEELLTANQILLDCAAGLINRSN
jgi:glutamine kinase